MSKIHHSLSTEQAEVIRNADPDTEFLHIWRNKFLCTEARTIAEFRQCFLDAAALLERWEALGIQLEPDSGIEDDYASFFTTSKEVALAEGFEPDTGFHDGDD